MPSTDISKLQLEPRHLTLLLQILEQYVPQAEVWAYGSRVTGKAHQGSDLDIVLRNVANLNVAQSDWSELQEALQQSTLPILVDVHDWALLPNSFYPNIERDYVVLQKSQ
ncbi:nucleotidyltransferase domain-containing protein [Rheinheimera soli]|jgi:predicted nucleotidyltransferase|uniref:Nucleotidyltransferase n=1 Tax=Rheinheimera soli TaxID=443616 RepID=A0ABU1W4Z0_9GAMM|nr:nucleotidyltransferase domain-containing protein [Rheinheimera soli]MDR7123037.1 putative nucleotidyltransferase [Rheinheimera soli]